MFFNRLSGAIGHLILDCLDTKDLLAVSQIDRYSNRMIKFRNGKDELTHLPQGDAEHSTLNKLSQMNAALLLHLCEYMRQRAHRYRIRSIFYEDHLHVTRIENFKKDLKLLMQLDLKAVNNNNVTLTKLWGYPRLIDNTSYEQSVPEEDRSDRNFYSFPFGFDVREKEVLAQSAKNPSLQRMCILLRICMELFYAVITSRPHYKQTLRTMRQILLRNLLQTEIAELSKHCQDVVANAKKCLVEFRKNNNWNLCYVWKGFLGFKPEQMPDPSRADKAYHDGSRIIGYETVTVPRGMVDQRREQPIYSKGEPCSLRYFYPFRDRLQEFNRIGGIFNELIRELSFSPSPRKEPPS